MEKGIIRYMSKDDAQTVLEIYRDGLATGEASFEHQAPTWKEWDAKHHSFSRLVYETRGAVLGWAAIAPVSPRRCYRGVAEVSIYIDIDHRAKGIGGQLMAALITDSERHGIWTLYSSIFSDNARTHKLHANHGFREVGIRERIAQQNGRWRDTLILERRSRVVG